MTTNSGRHKPDGEIPHWAATAGCGFRARRWAARLVGSPRRPRAGGTTRPDATTSDVPWSVRQRVLPEYHAGNLVQTRRASEEMVRAGFNAGAVPYGYRAQRVRVAPAGKRPRWRTRLVIEPGEVATVKMIFTWGNEDGLIITAIRERLVASRYPAPLNPKTGQPGVWTRAVIHAIPRNNPQYTGRQAWGHHHGRHTPRTRRVWSPVWAHAPLITVEEFAAANRRSWCAETPHGDTDAAWPSEHRRAA